MSDQQTVHRKEGGDQETYRVVPATDATGQEVGQHVFRRDGDEYEYVGEGHPLDEGWTPEEDLSRDDAPASCLEAIEEIEAEVAA